MRGDMCPYDHGADPVVVDDVSLGGVLFPGRKFWSLFPMSDLALAGANTMFFIPIERTNGLLGQQFLR